MEKIIEPDYSIGSFSFYNSDNMDIMKCYPDKYFELAIVDPPYNLGDKLIKGGTWSKKWQSNCSDRSTRKPMLPYYF